MDFFIRFLFVLFIKCTSGFELVESQCEPIVGECADLGYEHTSVSRSFERGDGATFASQRSADATIKSFSILLPCSNYMHIFLCGAYKPSCHQEAALIIRPCRSMCEHVYSRCFPLMSRFKKKWSAELNCSRFLDDKSERCMKDAGYTRDNPASQTSHDYIKQVDFLLDRIGISRPDEENSQPQTTTTTKKVQKNDPNLDLRILHLYEKYVCFSQYMNQNFETTLKVNESSVKYNLKCALKCGSDIEFSVWEKELMRTFILILSSLCLTASLFTIFTYFLKVKHHQYPNMIFFFMSLSNLIYSSVYLLSLNLSKEHLLCQRLDINQLTDNHESTFSYPLITFKTYFVYVENMFENSYCSINLLLAYYFRMSALSWWLMLSVSWFMSLQFNLDARKITQSSSCYFNFAAWSLPGLKTVLVLLSRSDGGVSEPTGTCSLESIDSSLKYQIIPSCIYLFIGFSLLLVGFFKIAKINFRILRNVKKQSSIKNAYLTRMGLAVIVCALPPLIVTACELIEYLNNLKSAQIPKSLFLEPKEFFTSEEALFYSTLKNKFNTSIFNENSHFFILIVHIIKVFMQFLNGFLIFFLVVLILNSNNDLNKTAKQKFGLYSSNDVYSTANDLSQSFQFKQQLQKQEQRCLSSTLPIQLIEFQSNQFIKKCDCGFNKISLPSGFGSNEADETVLSNLSSTQQAQQDHHYCIPHVLISKNSSVVLEGSSDLSNAYNSSLQDFNDTIGSSLPKNNNDSFKHSNHVKPSQMSTFSVSKCAFKI